MTNPKMATFYTYKPIDLATDTIRIVRLARGYDTDPITCDLVEILLSDDGVPYEALSYTWGNSIINVEISLCGARQPVRDGLYTALHCLRRADEDRFLWIDALCVDQGNHLEKTHQVVRMRRIYEQAEKVVIWLGRGGEDVELLMEMMGMLWKRVRKRIDYRREEKRAWEEEWPVFVEGLGGMKTVFNTRRREGLREVLGRGWFRRVWVLQEAWSARRAEVQCGRGVVSSETFVVMPWLMGVEVEGHVKAVLDIMPGCWRREGWGTERPNLKTLLAKFWESQATDGRDKVYALLGIASDEGLGERLQPDYGVAPGHVMRRVISYLLFGDGTQLICPLPIWGFESLVCYLDDLPARVLMWALDEGKETTVRELLGRTAVDINTGPEGEQPPLLQLAYNADKKNSEKMRIITRTLLEHERVSIKVTDKMGNTPLHIACAQGNTLMLKELLAQKEIGDVANVHNAQCRTPLGLAAEKGHNTAIMALLRHPAVDVEGLNGTPGFRQFSPLWLAVSGVPPWESNSHASAVSILVQHGADINARDTLYGETPLIAAAKHGDLAMVKFLIDSGADIEARDNSCNGTALWVAASRGHSDVVSLLLTRGAILDDGSQVRSQQTAIFAASKAGHSDTVRVILDQYPPPLNDLHTYLEIKDTFDRGTALWTAAHHGHHRVVEMLLDAGADINTKDSFNHSPLWTAIFNWRHSVSKLLLDRGARLQLGDAVEDGWTSTESRSPLRRDRVVSAYEKAGFTQAQIDEEIRKANGKDIDGQTPHPSD